MSDPLVDSHIRVLREVGGDDGATYHFAIFSETRPAILRRVRKGVSGSTVGPAALARSMRAEHVAPLLAFRATEELGYVLEDYIKGISAHDILESGRAMRWDVAAHVIASVAKAVDAVRKKLSANIRHVSADRVLVTFAGGAWFADSTRELRGTETTKASFRALSPEEAERATLEPRRHQAPGAMDAGEREVTFSLALLLRDLITGKPLHDAKTLDDAKVAATRFETARALEGLEGPVVAVLERALSKEPADRFSSLLGFEVALRALPLASTAEVASHLGERWGDKRAELDTWLDTMLSESTPSLSPDSSEDIATRAFRRQAKTDAPGSGPIAAATDLVREVVKSAVAPEAPATIKNLPDEEASEEEEARTAPFSREELLARFQRSAGQPTEPPKHLIPKPRISKTADAAGRYVHIASNSSDAAAAAETAKEVEPVTKEIPAMAAIAIPSQAETAVVPAIKRPNLPIVEATSSPDSEGQRITRPADSSKPLPRAPESSKKSLPGAPESSSKSLPRSPGSSKLIPQAAETNKSLPRAPDSASAHAARANDSGGFPRPPSSGQLVVREEWQKPKHKDPRREVEDDSHTRPFLRHHEAQTKTDEAHSRPILEVRDTGEHEASDSGPSTARSEPGIVAAPKVHAPPAAHTAEEPDASVILSNSVSRLSAQPPESAPFDPPRTEPDFASSLPPEAPMEPIAASPLVDRLTASVPDTQRESGFPKAQRPIETAPMTPFKDAAPVIAIPILQKQTPSVHPPGSASPAPESQRSDPNARAHVLAEPPVVDATLSMVRRPVPPNPRAADPTIQVSTQRRKRSFAFDILLLVVAIGVVTAVAYFFFSSTNGTPKPTAEQPRSIPSATGDLPGLAIVPTGSPALTFDPASAHTDATKKSAEPTTVPSGTKPPLATAAPSGGGTPAPSGSPSASAAPTEAPTATPVAELDAAPPVQARAFVTVICDPWCDQVEEGGQKLGPSPLVRVSMAPGKHTFRLHWSEPVSEKTATVDAKEGETTVLRVSP